MAIQKNVVNVGIEVFGRRAMRSKRERVLRLLEEVFELARVCGATRDDVEVIAAYEWNREIGPDIEQEFGGVGTTLYALADAHGIYLDDAVCRETRRVEANKAKIQAKNAAKPKLVRDEALA